MTPRPESPGLFSGAGWQAPPLGGWGFTLSKRKLGMPTQETRTVQAEKLRRIRAGGPVRTFDLFSGCGGIALGFHGAGFQAVGSVELDPHASRSFAANFLANSPGDSDALAAPKDITSLDPADALGLMGIPGAIDAAVDVLVGGPPCQAFARIGRAKLREVADHPEAFRQDPRGNLYLRYLAYIRALKPLAILMENVPDVLNFGGHNIPLEICECLSAEGYRCRYTLLNSVYYGVPQMRERMFLVAVHEACERDFAFPSPTHRWVLPDGYGHSRRIALRNVQAGSGGLGIIDVEDPFSTPPPRASQGLPLAITASDAISDLPRLMAARLASEGTLGPGTKRFETALPYGSGPLNTYQALMRQWPGFTEPPDGVRDHLIRYLPRDFHLFAAMEPGWQYPEIHAYAEKWFHSVKLPALLAEGAVVPSVPGPEFDEFKARFVPPYDPGKFINKWRKMEADQPSRTLLAHLGKDSYSHIHYDSAQGRTISVREAARLQSFPDGFIFDGTINPAFRQIGNAVPPLMAYALARSIRAALGLPPVLDIRSVPICKSLEKKGEVPR